MKKPFKNIFSSRKYKQYMCILCKQFYTRSRVRIILEIILIMIKKSFRFR